MILKHQSKNKTVLLAIFAVLLLGGISCLVWLNYFNKPKPIVCTQEVKLCPDNSTVGRTGPNCEFAKCPFGNDQVEKFITDYLLTQKYFSWKTTTDSRNFCVIENLNPTEEGLFPLYVWVNCREFILQNGKLKELSGVSVPVKIDYPNELSYYDISKMSHEAPRDGSFYPKDIKTIFPLNVQNRIADFDSKNINSRIEAIAVDWFRTENNSTEIKPIDQSKSKKYCNTDKDCVLWLCTGCVNKEWAKTASPEPPCATYEDYRCQCVNNKCIEIK